jgi:hypothetical protein
MANGKRKALLISRDSRERSDCRKIRSHGSSVSAASGMTGLLDTNVALYLLGGRLAEPLPTGSYGVSVITEMELLAWPSLKTEEEENVREFLNRFVICELTPINSRPSRATQEAKAVKTAGCNRLRHSNRIRRRALDQ